MIVIIEPKDMPIEKYHQGPPRWWSKTSLLNFKKKGAPWTKLMLDGKVQQSRPDGALQGQALDCYLTEGASEFAKKWSIKPDEMSFATKDGKAWKEANAGREILSCNDNLILIDAIDAVRSCCVWPEIEKSLAQHTIRRDQPALGIGLQARPDWINLQTGTIFDLKKTRSLEQFGRQAIDLGYHMQAALAGFCIADDGIQVEKSYLIAVEWERGARCEVLEIPHEYLKSGHLEMVSIARDVASRISANTWEHRQETPGVLSAPAFMERRMENAE